jgi:hypothetical protein
MMERAAPVTLSNDLLPTAVLRHGAYVCVRATADPCLTAGAPIEALARRLGLQNEFEASTGHPAEAIAFLRRLDVAPAQIADARLGRADAIVHVASPSGARVEEFCAELARLVDGLASLVTLRGVQRPPSFTGAAMHNFAYAHQLQQQPGDAMPNAFIVPIRKTAEWWGKSWMERHTYLLPRFDEDGRQTHEGHALAAAAGIPHLMRRTYTHPTQPAPEGEYDFLTYFECADASVPVFFDVRAALADTKRNPEWTFVREGPTWRGHRVRTWADLFSSCHG